MEKKPRVNKKSTVILEDKKVSNEPNNSSELILNPTKEYSFIGNGTFHLMPKGSIWKMLGSQADILIKKGYGSIK